MKTIWIMLWDIHILMKKKKRQILLCINDNGIGTNSVFSIYDSFMISHFASFRKCCCSNLSCRKTKVSKKKID